MLTHLQRRAMLFIEAAIERSGGVSPTIRDIAEHLSLHSRGHAHRLLCGLEERGFIARLPRRRNAISVVRPTSRFAVFRFNNATKKIEICGATSEVEVMSEKRKNPES